MHYDVDYADYYYQPEHIGQGTETMTTTESEPEHRCMIHSWSWCACLNGLSRLGTLDGLPANGLGQKLCLSVIDRQPNAFTEQLKFIISSSRAHAQTSNRRI